MNKIVEIADSKYEDFQLEEIANAIRDSKVLIMPADTIYGFSSIKSSEARVREIKRREVKPFIYLISNYDMLKSFDINIDIYKTILERNWPNMITFILKNRVGEKIGIRMPNDSTLLEIVERVKEPIVSTSVNYSNEPPITDIDEIIDEFHDKVDLIVADRSFSGIKESTIVDLSENRPKIIREGAAKLIM